MDTVAFIFLCVSLVMLLAPNSQVAALHRRIAALSRIESKLDLLLKDAAVPYEDPFADLLPPVVEAIRAGDKIEAIKRYRQATGAGLKESKEFVEELQRRAGFSQ